MRYVQPELDLKARAERFIGRTVRLTSEMLGEVREAYPHRGRINLLVQDSDGFLHTTDNEHATIVREP